MGLTHKLHSTAKNQTACATHQIAFYLEKSFEKMYICPSSKGGTPHTLQGPDRERRQQAENYFWTSAHTDFNCKNTQLDKQVCCDLDCERWQHEALGEGIGFCMLVDQQSVRKFYPQLSNKQFKTVQISCLKLLPSTRK